MTISTTDHLSNARQHLATAEEMIEEMGYGRRRPDIDELHTNLKTLIADCVDDTDSHKFCRLIRINPPNPLHPR